MLKKFVLKLNGGGFKCNTLGVIKQEKKDKYNIFQVSDSDDTTERLQEVTIKMLLQINKHSETDGQKRIKS